MPGRVAGELLGVELTRSRDQVVDGLVRLDAEHDRGVAELKVEVEQECPLPPVLGQRGREVRRQHGLPGPALGREDGDESTLPPAAVRLLLATCVAGLPDREDDVVGELRKQQDVGDVRVQRVFEQARRAAGGEQDHGGLRVFPDRGYIVRRQRRAARRMQHDLQVPAGQGRGALEDVVARADELDLGVLSERLAQVGQAVADAAHEDADAVSAVHFHLVRAHRGPPTFRGHGARRG